MWFRKLKALSGYPRFRLKKYNRECRMKSEIRWTKENESLRSLCRADRVRDSNSRVHPARDQSLNAGLPAEMLHIGIMRAHVFPGVDLQERALRRVLERPITLRPCKPPVVDAAFLLAADLAMECLGPCHNGYYSSKEPTMKLQTWRGWLRLPAHCSHLWYRPTRSAPAPRGR